MIIEGVILIYMVIFLVIIIMLLEDFFLGNMREFLIDGIYVCVLKKFGKFVMGWIKNF